jgi:hypothetical protein
MEAIEVKTTEKVLYWRDTEAENRTMAGAEAAARALNELMSHYKFKDVMTEIPTNVNEWMITRTMQVNPKLAKLAQTYKLESLKFEVPSWIQKAGNAFSNWHATKSTHIQFMRFLIQKEEFFTVDQDALENEFETSESYRKYLTQPEQIKRLEECRTFMSLLKSADINDSKFLSLFGRAGNPWVRIIGDQFIICKEYVLNGAMHQNAPVMQERNYYLDGWQLLD